MCVQVRVDEAESVISNSKSNANSTLVAKDACIASSNLNKAEIKNIKHCCSICIRVFFCLFFLEEGNKVPYRYQGR
jgi:hypothetical protein